MLITGGGSGINYGVARQMAAHGAHLCLMGRRKEVVENAAQTIATDFGCKAVAVQGDVRKYEDCEKAVAEAVSHLGGLDVLVNGAAGNFLAQAEKLTSNGFRTVIEIDLIGTFNMSRAAFPHLTASKRSPLILNISATLGYGATPLQIHASAAKMGVDSVTRSLAMEWGRFGIRVCGVAPGPIADTEGFQRLGGELSKPTDVPIQRFGVVNDIGYSAVYLASAAGSFITGHTLVVDGGAWLVKQYPNDFTKIVDLVPHGKKKTSSKL